MKNKNKLLNAFFGLLLGAISGAAFILAFPPFEIWPLIFIGWAPVLIAQHHVMPRKLSSIPTALAIGIWLEGYMGPIFNPTGSYMIYLPLVAALISFLVDMGKRRFNEKTGYRWFVLEGALSWAGIEMIRLFIPIAGTWGFIAYPLYRQLWFIQPASIFGIIGVGMFVMMINLVLAQGILHWLKLREGGEGAKMLSGRMVSRWSTGTALALVGWTILSLILFIPADGPMVKTAAIQPEVSPIITGNRGEEALLAEIHANIISETRKAAEEGAEFIVWPEGALQYDPQEKDPLGLQDLARETGSYLAIGYVVNVTEGVFRNEATVISPQGDFLGVFGKDHPVLSKIR